MTTHTCTRCQVPSTMKSQSVERLDVSGLRGRCHFYLDYHIMCFQELEGLLLSRVRGMDASLLGTRAMKTHSPGIRKPSIQCISLDTPHEQHGSPPKAKYLQRSCLGLIIVPWYRHQKLNSKQGSSEIYDRRNTPLHLVSADESKAPSFMQGFARNLETHSPIWSIHRADSGSDL